MTMMQLADDEVARYFAVRNIRSSCTGTCRNLSA